LFLVIGFTLGKRFGLPEMDRIRVNDSRDQIEAFGLSMRRAKLDLYANDVLRNEAEERIRRLARCGPMVPWSDVRNRTSIEVLNLFDGSFSSVSDRQPTSINELLRVLRQLEHRQRIIDA